MSKMQNGRYPPEGSSDLAERDRRLFNQVAESYCRKDLEIASRIPRQSMSKSLVKDILGGGLGSVVEVGCGGGFFARHLEGSYSRYLGLDHSEQMVRIAHRMNGEIPNARFKKVDIGEDSLDFLVEEDVNVFVGVGILHHLKDPVLAIKRLSGFAKPGTHFCFMEPNNRNALIQGARALRAKLDSAYSSDQVYFSRDEMLSIMKESGLSQVSVRYHGYFSTPFSQVTLKPGWIFAVPSLFMTRLDEALEAWRGNPFARFSWNLISMGVLSK